MKTIVYIDGYNLYFGCLKNSPFKWLDIYSLCLSILNAQYPHTTSLEIKYFTADIKARVATHGQTAQQSQNNYHRALITSYPDKITIIKGFHTLERAKLPVYKRPLVKTDRAEVWRIEEKQTDVNIALHAYRDVIQKNCEQVVLVSNDTDLEPVLQIIRQDVGQSITIGIIIPVPKPVAGQKRRPPNERLSQYANWTRRYILDDELAQAQLPVCIPTNKEPIKKPCYW